MLDVDRITDFDQLKQVTRILHKENQRLHQKLAKYVRELATLRGESAQRRLALEISELQSQMNAVQRQLGKVSEKRGTGEPKDGEDKPQQRGHGPRLQPKLALEEQVHELPADERSCPACHGQLEQMGDQSEDSEEITVVQRQFELIRRAGRKHNLRFRLGPRLRTSIPASENGRYVKTAAQEISMCASGKVKTPFDLVSFIPAEAPRVSEPIRDRIPGAKPRPGDRDT